MKSILKSLLIIGIMAAFLQACLYFSPTTSTDTVKNKPASSVSELQNHETKYMKSTSKIDSQSVSSGNFKKWFYLKKKAART